MNISPFMLAAVFLAQGPPTASPETASLVARLASKSQEDREAASTALKALGTAALAPLRAARDGSTPALRGRVADLLEEIEEEDLVRPRSVALDYDDRPMSEVVQDLTKRTGSRVSIYEKQLDWLATRITLRTPTPVPFWTAIDKVCEAGRFESNFGSGPDGPGVRLFRESIPGPVSDEGPFRVQLKAVYFGGRCRQLHLKPEGEPATKGIRDDRDREKSCVELVVNVEPRTLIKNAGKLKGLSAVDGRGRSLIPDDPAGARRRHDYGFFAGSTVVEEVPLARVEVPGKVIRSLRGVAPVMVAALREDVVVIPLLDADGKAFRGDRTVVTILGVRKEADEARIVVEEVDPDGKVDRDQPVPMEGLSVALSIRANDRHGLPAPAPEVIEDQFEVVDAAGKVWAATPWMNSGLTPEVRGREVRLDVRPSGEDGEPMPWPRDLKGVSLRYRELTVVAVDVPFEFADVPLP